MKKLGTVRFKGRSGNRYPFDAFSLQTDLEGKVAGVFVVSERKRSKSKPGYVHARILTGQSDDLRESLADGKTTFADQGANCFCVHAQDDEAVRTSIEKDLTRKRPPAKAV